uniref:Uncharacterized protein n=1 Tax=Anguilla anguilla TaxID=7936 RepID=A0A0E9RGH8_ANGAN
MPNFKENEFKPDHSTKSTLINHHNYITILMRSCHGIAHQCNNVFLTTSILNLLRWTLIL